VRICVTVKTFYASDPCGGPIVVAEETNLHYENTGNTSQEETCIFIISAVNGNSINFTLVQLNLGELSVRWYLGLHQILRNVSIIVRPV